MTEPCYSYQTTSGGCAPQTDAASCGCHQQTKASPACVSCGCDCAPGMVGALQMLCSGAIAPLIDFDQFAFVTPYYILGTSYSCPAASAAPYDNLTGPLAAEFVHITTNSCERLEVSGQIYPPQPVCTGVTPPCGSDCVPLSADEVSLCQILAVAFTVSAENLPPVPPFSPVEPSLPNPLAVAYAQAKSRIMQALRPGCGPQPVGPAVSTPCDSSGDRRRVLSLTAGPLLLGNVSVLGTVGDVQVLANDTDMRFYFVCKDAIAFAD